MILRCTVASYAPNPTDSNHHLPTILLLHESRGVHGPARGPGMLWGPIRILKPQRPLPSCGAYDLSRTVNDAGLDVPGCLRRHQRCHQGRRRCTRAINCWTP